MQHQQQHRRLIALLLILGIATTQSLATCPSRCESCDSNQSFCESKNYRSFPAEFPASTTLIYLINNSMTTISDQALAHHSQNLITLYLNKNGLNSESLGPKGFHTLENLETLVLNHNRFESVRHSMFAGMRKLKQLWISYNYISIIDRDAFTNMTSLVEVKLTGNRLMQVPSLMRVPSLQRIHLDDNNIKKIQYSFINLDLHDITLANNQLKVIRRDSFGKIGQMSKFNISGNLLTSAPPLIKNMTALVSLDISRNPIQQLPADLLTKALKIKYLDVSRMNLRTLDEGFIPRNRYPNTVRIANNPWECNCNLRFLQQWSRRVFTVDSDLATCAGPLSRRDTLIKKLTLQDLGCDELQIQYPPRSDVGTTSNSNNPSKTHRAQETEEKPKTVTCTSTVCGKGGTCKDSGGVVSCVCSSGWTGKLCERRINEATNAASTTTTTELNLDQALRMQHPTKSDTIAIYVPQINNPFLLTVEKVISKNEKVEHINEEITPKERVYEIGGLAPATTYFICLRMVPVLEFPQDYLCNHDTTQADETALAAAAPPVDTINDHSDPPPTQPEQPGTDTLGGGEADVSEPAEPDLTPDHQNKATQTEKHGVVETVKETMKQTPVHRSKGGDTGRITASNPSVDPVGGKSQPTDENVSMMFPLIGAGLAAFVILVLGLMLYTCQRNKRKLDDQVGSGGDRYMAGRKHTNTGEPLMETTEMMTMQQQRSTPSPHYQQTQQPQQATTYLYQGNNGELYQVPSPQPTCNGNFTPNCNGSLARSSVSGGSNGQQQQRYSPQTSHHLQNPINTTYAAGPPPHTEPPEVVNYSNGKLLPAQSLPVTYYNSPPAPQQQQRQPNMATNNVDMQRRRHASETQRNCSPMTVTMTTHNDGRTTMGRSSQPGGMLMKSNNGNSTSIQYHSVPIVASRVNNTTTSYTSSYMQMNSNHTVAPFTSTDVVAPSIQRQNSAPYGSGGGYSGMMTADCHQQQPGLGAQATQGRMMDTVVM